MPVKNIQPTACCLDLRLHIARLSAPIFNFNQKKTPAAFPAAGA
jgi:hypothetical protein